MPILREALKKTGISAEVQNGLRETLEGLKKTFLSVTIKSEKSEYKLSEEVKLSCTMKNEGDEPIIVLPPLDGSLTKNRQPYYTYQVTRDDEGKPIVVTAQPGMTEDNFLNAFKPEDFVKIEPGKEAPINPQFVGWWFEMQKRPCQYKIRLKYSLQRTFAASGDLQKHVAAVDKLMTEAWEGEKTSNEIELTIKPEEK